MTMAYWNGMTWGVSSKEIAFLESLTTSFSIETSTNADKEGKSPTESVARSLVEFSLSTTYRVETGTRDIRGVINSWKALVGTTGPLVIGGSTFGPDRMQLQDVGVSNLRLNASGVMLAVTLSFKFKEFSEAASGVKTTSKSKSKSGTGSGTFKTTAVNRRPSASTKAEKKTVAAKTVGNKTVVFQASKRTKGVKERM